MKPKKSKTEKNKSKKRELNEDSMIILSKEADEQEVEVNKNK